MLTSSQSQGPSLNTSRISYRRLSRRARTGTPGLWRTPARQFVSA
jgi:hypothetical protein